MVRKDANSPLTATEFKPLDASGHRQRKRIAPGYFVLAAAIAFTALILVYMFFARAVIFRVEPENARIDISGLSFHIGDNFLLLPGEHTVTAVAEGYEPYERPISVGEESSQEIAVKLEPLPGHLSVVSQLEDVQVLIDNEVAGTAPGLIRDIPKGTHKLEFLKHRYCPLQQEIDIEGLGATQSVEISLVPAWGQMAFSSIPEGADLYVDDQLMGKTPLATEILETGSDVRLSLFGYKTWQKRLSITAGQTASYPAIELTVADGTVEIGSAPKGAGVTVDDEFRGNTPLTIPLSPLGDHRIELFLEGYRKALRTISVEPEQHSSLEVELSPILGNVRLTVEPEDAEVLVDGNNRGRGSQVLRLTAKKHTVTIRKPGYVSRSTDIVPRSDHEQAVAIKLLTHQQAYWESRPPLIRTRVGSELKLFRVGARFTMGAARREPGRRANEVERGVRLERPFYLGTHEVSNAEFRQWKEEHSSGAVQGQTLDMDDQPVANVSWEEAALFCNWLSQKEGLPLFYIVENAMVTGFDPQAHGYRLPTEAEWSWAARIGATGKAETFPWGNDLYPPVGIVENYADVSAARILPFTLTNYNDGYPVSAKTGSFAPNQKGLYDMSGNVAEWVNDFYDIQPRKGEYELDPMGPDSGNRHTIRGGSWALGSRTELRLTYRDAGSDGRMDLGFRIARYVDKADAAP